MLLSMSSNISQDSVVKLSLNPSYAYQYASIFDPMKYLWEDEQSFGQMQAEVSRFCWANLLGAEKSQPGKAIFVTTDGTPYRREYTTTLADRQAISVPNATHLSKTQLSVGYKVSAINLSNFSDNWSLPLSLQRVGFEQTETVCGREQLSWLLDTLGPQLGDRLVINLADSGYGNGKFLGPLQAHANLINIVRLRVGTKVFDRHDQAEGQPNKYYGPACYLRLNSGAKRYKKRNEAIYYEVWQRAIHEQAPDEVCQFEERLQKSGRRINVIIKRWNNKLLRTKSGMSMKDKPVDIVCIMLRDAQTQQGIFAKDMYLCISGKQRAEIKTPKVRAYYLRRNDIEAYFRLAKKRLLLEAFQTSRRRHLDNWLLVVQLASCLWWQASDEVIAQPNPWERYDPKYKQAARYRPQRAQPGPGIQPQAPERLSMAMTARAMASILATLDLRAFHPPKSKGGTGRAKGYRLEPKKRYPMRRKHKKRVGK